MQNICIIYIQFLCENVKKYLSHCIFFYYLYYFTNKKLYLQSNKQTNAYPKRLTL